MRAIRCVECGDTRWSILGIAVREPGRCQMCGGQMVRERREPLNAPGKVLVERRDLPVLARSRAPRAS